MCSNCLGAVKGAIPHPEDECKGGCKKLLTGKKQLNILSSLDDDHELPINLFTDISVHTDSLKSVQDNTMVDSSLHKEVKMDNVRSSLSDSSKASIHFSILPSPQHLTGVEDVAASPTCTPAAEGEVHISLMGVAPPGALPVVLPFIQV